jgi:hypothetical protein
MYLSKAETLSTLRFQKFGWQVCEWTECFQLSGIGMAEWHCGHCVYHQNISSWLQKPPWCWLNNTYLCMYHRYCEQLMYIKLKCKNEQQFQNFQNKVKKARYLLFGRFSNASISRSPRFNKNWELKRSS